jgi:hypothetical protein
MEAPDDPRKLKKPWKGGETLGFLLLFLLLATSLGAQEVILGEGEHRGSLISQEKQVFKIGPVKPGQTLQVACSPQWSADGVGRVDWTLEDAGGAKLRAASQTSPDAASLSLEWTSNSEPRPDIYVLQIQPSGGGPGEALGDYSLFILLLDQNDGDSGTDAPESYEKALLLPAQDPRTYVFDDCFLSGTADLYDIYKIQVKPNHSLNFGALPLQWKGSPKGKVTWEFLNKSYKIMKKGQISPGQSTPLGIKIFYPQVRSDERVGLYYFLVKIEGDASLSYSLHLEIKEGP